MTSTADTIHAAYSKLYKTRFMDFPKSLQDELSRLAGAVKVGGEAHGDMSKWLEDGWKLYKAASLGLQPASARKMMKGPLESQVFIAKKSVCTEVQKAFRDVVAPAAKELIASGVVIPGLSKDVRDYLGK